MNILKYKMNLNINKMKNQILKRTCQVLTFLLFLVPSVLLAKDKPNVIIVITDDQGMGDLGCMGNPYIKTPNIDDFYSNAVRLTNFHVSTTCASHNNGSIATF
jgi:hypothetical protein